MKTEYTVEAFLKSRRAKGLKSSTIVWYRGILYAYAKMFPELPEKPEAVDDFLISCPAGDERRHGYYRTLRVFYRFAERRLGVKNIVDPDDEPKRTKKKPRPLTLDELDQLISYPHPMRIMAAIMFMADSGARIGETVNLKPKDFILTEWGPVAIVNGKTGERFVPIEEATYRKLLNVLPFKIKVNRLSRLVSAAFREARVKGTAHKLRHTFGTYWDGDEKVLKDIMGHSRLSTTELYRGFRMKKMCEEHREYSPLKRVLAGRQFALSL
ncbi:MAG: hypothetical protein WC312_05240 [Candidatus Omnitrophota bacterium]|jgi:integrase